ncbi:MAG: GNAT family N-acetyltransferase [Thermodesulfobacteriota bacterium]
MSPPDRKNDEPAEIRPVFREDVPLLLGLIRELAAYEKLAHEVRADEAILGESLFGSRPAAEALLVFHAGAPAGYCLFFHNFSTFLGRPGLYVEDLYIKPRFRRRGLGRAVFRRLAGLARERGCARLEFSVLDWNEPALRFYENLGAAAQGQWKLYRFLEEDFGRLAG